MGVVAAAIHRKLTTTFQPERLEIVDDSDKHAGHAGSSGAGETHFSVLIEAAAFRGVTRVQRQRQVYGVLAEELAGPIHALAVRALAPGES